MSDDLRRATAVELREGYATGSFSALEVVEALLRVIDDEDAKLGAWLHLRRDAARNEATAADRAYASARASGPEAVRALAPLLGVPVALKDLVNVVGTPTTAGSKMLDGYVSPYDATIAVKLKEAGAIILGKTNMDEFAMGSSTEFSAFRRTANPWDLDRVPGGSSGGSAAAVSAHHVPLSIGSDTGGSIRQPASLTGITGVKPTYGRVSRYGIVAFASSLDQIGPFARSAQDAALLLHAIAGADPRDATSATVPVDVGLRELPQGDLAANGIKGKRLALPREYFVAGMEPGVEAAVRAAVATLESAGAVIDEVSLPTTEHALATYYIVAPAEASANLARYDGIRYGASRHGDGDLLDGYLATRGRGFGPEVRRRIMLGTYALSAGFYDAYYVKAQKVRTLIARDFERVWSAGYDAIVAPASPSVAWRFGAKLGDPVAMYLADACTIPTNMAGLPGLSTPCGLSDGLPIGLQLIGAPWSEARLLAIASGYEALTSDAPWRSQDPAALSALRGVA